MKQRVISTIILCIACLSGIVFFSPNVSRAADLAKKTFQIHNTYDQSVTSLTCYEDKEGNETELTGKFKVTVNSPVYDNVEKIKDTTTKINKNIIIAVCIAVILIVALIAGTIRRNKRKKRILEEF